MILKNKLIRTESGGVVILVAIMLPLLMMILGVTIDLGRSYAARSKAQTASDAALLGAVSTASTLAVNTEMTRLFNANYPANYMGGTAVNIVVTAVSQGQYTAQVSFNVPTVIMKIFGTTTQQISVHSTVNSGYQLSAPQTLELALVFDNSGVANTAAMRLAANSMVNILFGASNTLSNVHVSMIPYDVAVDVGNNHATWVLPAWLARYNQFSTLAGGGRGFLANRNNDAPPDALVDVSDAAPTTNTTRFRTPVAYGAGLPLNAGLNPDYETTNKLALMQFGLNSKPNLLNAFATMQPTGGNLRIDVGLLWGWLSLSPNWQGRFNPALPGLPAATSPVVGKRMVLVVTGKNNVYTGQVNKSNDDTTTKQMCDAIKSRSITLYVVAYGASGSYNFNLLQNCATATTYFYPASTGAALVSAFNSIADSIQYDTLRLVQ